LARQIEAPELSYQWHWEAGRIQAAEGARDAAIQSYRRAVLDLQSVRMDLGTDLIDGNVGFREVFGPLYYELADLLLARAGGESSASAKRALLEEARATVELSKAAELADYFQDGCVTAQLARVKRVEAVAQGVAFIYPIILRDRLELLLSHAGGIEQFTVPVARDALVAEVRNFRLRLERYSTLQYMVPARKLYGWLFAPFEPALARLGISTLVVIPDSALRTIPFGALHDGNDFVVRRFAFATTPGLELTDPRALPVKDMRVLLSGVTQSVQGYDALPNVTTELGSIGGLYPGRLLKDGDFILPKVERELGAASYSVVHIASHGQFDSDPERTFLLTYDEKISMNRLEKLIAPSRYRDQPIELLTLSACQTAAGDDRAALGLAGVAIKAGARSALASLWFINDESSAILMAEFYRQLRVPGVGKAQALRHAQLKLLDDKRFDNPAFWGAFLLIGNWL
jgi:CHAT domain-containing protein